MTIKPTIAIIKKHSFYKDDFTAYLESSDYQLVGTASSIDGGVKLLNSAKINVLILGLQLDDGDGTALIRYLIERNPKVNNPLSYIFIISEFMDDFIEKEVSDLLFGNSIQYRCFNKNNGDVVQAIFNRLELIKNEFLNCHPTIKFDQPTIRTLKNVIYHKLNAIGISKSSKFREFLARTIESIILEELFKFNLEEIFDKVTLSFHCEFEGSSLGAIQKGVRRAIQKAFSKNPDKAISAYKDLTTVTELIPDFEIPSTKQFVRHLANSIRDEFPDLIPKDE